MAVTDYIWDPVTDSYLMEKDDAGATTAVYTNEPQPFGGLGSQRRGDDCSFYHFDGLGSTRELTDRNETVTDTFLYNIWGTAIAHTGSTVVPFRYSAEEWLYFMPELGAYATTTTLYSPTLARWVSQTPGLIPSGSSIYSFDDNQPANASPPGHCDKRGPIGDPIGQFLVDLSSCSAATKKVNPGCCCTQVDVRYFPTTKQKQKFKKICLRIWVETKVGRYLCPDTNKPWHPDNHANMSCWVPKRAHMPAMWDDSPGNGPSAGWRFSIFCPNFCEWLWARQRFEVCAIGHNGGKATIIGCVRYGHYCKFQYTKLSPGNAPCLCYVSCRIARWGDGRHDPGDPEDSPEDVGPDPYPEEEFNS